jgi:hypothetical protein
MNREELEILSKAFGALLSEQSHSAESLDALEARLRQLMPAPPAANSFPAPSANSFAAPFGAEDPFSAPAPPKPQPEPMAAQVSTFSPSGLVEQLQTELDMLKEELKAVKQDAISYKNLLAGAKEEAIALREMSEMTIKYMLADAHAAEAAGKHWEKMAASIGAIEAQLFAQKPEEALPGAFFMPDPAKPFGLYADQRGGCRYFVLYSLPFEGETLPLMRLVAKLLLQKLVHERRYTTPALLIEHFEWRMQQCQQALSGATSPVLAAVAVLEGEEAEVSSNGLPLLLLEGKVFREFDMSRPAADAQDGKYRIKRFRLGADTALFIPTSPELPHTLLADLQLLLSAQTPEARTMALQLSRPEGLAVGLLALRG